MVTYYFLLEEMKKMLYCIDGFNLKINVSGAYPGTTYLIIAFN